MFVKKCEALTANMVRAASRASAWSVLTRALTFLQPDTVPVENGQQSAATQAIAENQPGLATSASGAAGALAGWAFASVSKKVRSSRSLTLHVIRLTCFRLSCQPLSSRRPLSVARPPLASTAEPIRLCHPTARCRVTSLVERVMVVRPRVIALRHRGGTCPSLVDLAAASRTRRRIGVGISWMSTMTRATGVRFSTWALETRCSC